MTTEPRPWVEVRDRLHRAGLLLELPPPDDDPPDPDEIEAARTRAGGGTLVSDLVIEGRGP